jgi:DNA-binding SARP family transcriptional activator
MCDLVVRLFGSFEVKLDNQRVNGWNARKAQELLAYLLLHRERLHPRQVLAELLWPESTTEQSLKYLRHALWQLQTALDCLVLEADSESLNLRWEANLWLDVMEFERASVAVHGIPGEDLDEHGAHQVQEALTLYRGDLLEGWYSDWCLFERERLQRTYLATLEKLMAYCEVRGRYETGLEYGTCALRYEAAHERIHRRLMRLHYLAGDRTAALRQYARCVALLREELDVEPSERTVALYEHIRSGRYFGPGHGLARGNGNIDEASSPVDRALYHLNQIQIASAEIERHSQKVIQAVKEASNGCR